MKRWIAGIALLVVLAGCDDPPKPTTADQKQAQATEQLTSQAQNEIGMPAIKNFTERRWVKQLYEIRDDEKLVCYAYVETLDGHLRFLTKCLGYGLPYGVQFTSPTHVVDVHPMGSYDFQQVPQPEPNGLFMPSTAEATWLMVPDAKGNAHPLYVEPRVVVSPTKLPAALDNPSD